MAAQGVGLALGPAVVLLVFEGPDQLGELVICQIRRTFHTVAGKVIRLAVPNTELA